MKVWALTAAIVFLFQALAYAADAGPRDAVARVRSEARRLLAHTVRGAGLDPTNLTIDNVIVVHDQALLSWDSGKEHGVMGLMMFADRWWDALDMSPQGKPGTDCWSAVRAYPLIAPHPYPDTFIGGEIMPPPSPETIEEYGFSTDLAQLAAANNADVKFAETQTAPVDHLARPVCHTDGYAVHPRLPIDVRGGVVHPPRSWTAGYDITIHYAGNDAAKDASVASILARAPTRAEFLPNVAPPNDYGGPTDVAYFDVDVGGTKPISFSAGTSVDVWFPFVLDDRLRYDISFFAGGRSLGPYHGTLFDNVLHFELPAFTVVPGKGFQAEISGWY